MARLANTRVPIPDYTRLLILLLVINCPAVTGAFEGVDFSNNLFSDLGPILSLFGEQVTKQFIAGSTTWEDNIIISMAPLGIMTIIVAAIRIGGPLWLKAIVGRARENKTMAEVELTTSTSRDVCELWDGNTIVRTIAGSSVFQLVYLPNMSQVSGAGSRRNSSSKNPSTEDSDSQINPEKQLFTLKKGVEAEKFERHPRRTIGNWTDKLFNSEFKTFKQNLNTGATDIESANASSNSRAIKIKKPTDRQKLDALEGAPNIFLNLRPPKTAGQRWSLRFWTALAVTLQATVLIISGSGTYYRPLTSKLTLEDSVAHDYAYPLTLGGTLILIGGLIICSYILDGSTTEVFWSLKKDEAAHILWMQKGGNINDQDFEPCVILGEGTRKGVLTSSLFSKSAVPGASQIGNSEKPRDLSGPENDVLGDSSPLKASKPIQTLVIIGTVMAISGFIIQFTGLRAMHWSASVAQLVATLIMVIVRTWIRRDLAQKPRTHKVPKGHELDWLATNLATLPGLSLWDDRQKKDSVMETNSKESGECSNDSDSQQKGGVQNRFEWRVVTGAESDKSTDNSRLHPTSDGETGTAQNIMKIRERIGYLSGWRGRATKTAIALADVIEAIMNALLQSDPNTELYWRLPIQMAGGKTEIVSLAVKRPSAKGSWEIQASEIEALLSLWLYSVEGCAEDRDSTALEEVDSDIPGSDWLRQGGEKSRTPAVRLLGPVTGRALKDLRWYLGSRMDHIVQVSVEVTPGGQIAPLDCTYPSRQVSTLRTQRPHPDYDVPNNPTTEQADESETHHQEHIIEASRICGYLRGQLRMEKQGGGKSRKIQRPTSFSHPIAQNAESANYKSNIVVVGNSNIVKSADSIRNTTPNHLTTTPGARDEAKPTNQATSVTLAPDCHQAITPAEKNIAAIDHNHDNTALAANHAPRLDTKGTFADIMQLAAMELASVNDVRELLGIISDTSLETFFAQNLFAAFIRAVAERMERIKGDTKPMSAANLSWRDIRLENSALLKILDEVEGVWSQELGAFDYMYCVFLHALSFHSKLPMPSYLLSYALDLARDLESKLDWKKATEVYVWLLDNSMDFGPEYPRSFKIQAFAAALEFERLLEETKEHGQDLNNEIFLKECLEMLRGSLKLHISPRSIEGGGKHSIEDVLRSLHNIQNDTNPSKLLGLEHDWTDFQQAYGNDLHLTPLHLLILRNIETNTDTTLPPNQTNPFSGRMSSSSADAGRRLRHINEVRAQVKALASANLDRQDCTGWTPLHYAVKLGFDDIVKIFSFYKLSGSNSKNMAGKIPLHYSRTESMTSTLLHSQRRAQLDVQDKNGCSPLLCAMKDRSTHVVRQLVEAGANMALTDNTQRTSLHWAAYSGNEELVKFFVERGCNVVARDVFGRTALHLAAGNNKLTEQMYKDLQATSTQLDVTDANGWTPLQHAVVNGQVDSIKILLGSEAEGEELNLSKHINGLLQLAVRKGQVNTVSLLLTKHPDSINCQDKLLQTPLHIASTDGHEAIVKLLLNQKGPMLSQKQPTPNLETKDSHGYTALHCAVMEGNGAVVQMLGDFGAHLTVKDHGGFTPLDVASMEGHKDTVKVLLDLIKSHPVRDQSQNEPGSASLHLASARGHTDVVKLLFEHGLDIMAKDDTGNTPLEVASMEGHTDTVRVLLGLIKSRYDYVETELGPAPVHLASAKGHTDVVQLLFEHGLDIMAKDDSGNTPLHLAIESGHESLTRWLMTKTEIHNLNAMNNHDFTPLHLAILSGNETNAKLLLAAGATISSQMIQGLHLATKEGREEFIRIWLKLGMDCRTKDADGDTPLHVASREGHATIVKMLLQHGAILDEKNLHGATSLSVAKEAGHLGVATILAAFRADMDGKDTHRELLHPDEDIVSKRKRRRWGMLFNGAAREGHERLFKMLLAFIDEQNLHGDTSLGVAIEARYLGVMEVMKSWVDVIEEDTHGSRSLHFASQEGYLEALEMLVELRTDIRRKGIDANTQLKNPLQHRNTEQTREPGWQHSPNYPLQRDNPTPRTHSPDDKEESQIFIRGQIELREQEIRKKILDLSRHFGF